MLSQDRKELLKTMKEIFKKNFFEESSKSFFKLVDEEDNIEFHLSSILNLEKEKGSISKEFITSLIPNDISGSLATSNVIIFNLNMGGGKNGISFIEDINKLSNNEFEYSPTKTQYVLNDDETRDFSFSQTIFFKAIRDKQNIGMKKKIFAIMSEEYTVLKAKELYLQITNNLIYIYGENQINEEDLIAIPSIYDDLEEYGLLPEKDKEANFRVNTLSNFYRHVLIPLLQLRFPFEEELIIAPIFLATDPYYVPIDDNDHASKRLRINYKEYSWNGSFSWLNYIFNKKKIPFLDKEISLLEKLGVQSFSDIMLVQIFPYASNNFSNKHNLNVFNPWINFIKDFCRNIDEYNFNHPNDQIDIVINRKGNNYLEKSSLSNSNVWVRKNPYSGRKGYLSSSSFKRIGI